MALTTIASLQTLGLPEILLWLLSFALINGLLHQAQMPKSAASRTIIAIVAAFFVLFAVPDSMISVLAQMSSGLVLIIVGLLVLFVFFEVAGVKAHRDIEVTTKEGQTFKKREYLKVHEKYGMIFAAILGIMAILLFVGAGGLALLGWQMPDLTPYTQISFLFLVVIIGMIAWMVKETSKEKEEK